MSFKVGMDVSALHYFRSSQKKIQGNKISSGKIQIDEICGKTQDDFKNRRSFLSHHKTHSEELFYCDQCPKEWDGGPDNVFSSKEKKRKYMFEHHDKPATCDTCGNIFSTYSNMKIHEKSHSVTYECDVCHKTFSTKYNCTVHEKSCRSRIDTNEEVFSCDMCNKTYSNNSNLRKHHKTHSEIKQPSDKMCYNLQ